MYTTFFGSIKKLVTTFKRLRDQGIYEFKFKLTIVGV